MEYITNENIFKEVATCLAESSRTKQLRNLAFIMDPIDSSIFSDRCIEEYVDDIPNAIHIINLSKFSIDTISKVFNSRFSDSIVLSKFYHEAYDNFPELEEMIDEAFCSITEKKSERSWEEEVFTEDLD